MTERTITMHRIGGFYEARGVNAKLIAKVADLWTGNAAIRHGPRSNGDTTVVSGFPAGEAATHVAALEAAGITIHLDETPGASPLPSAAELDERIRAAGRPTFHVQW
jgi:hypothetical protein